MRTPHVKPLYAAVLLAAFVGCKSTQVIGYPAEWISVNSPARVTITTPDKSIVEMWGPQLHGDTLVGFLKGSGEYLEMPIGDVKIMMAPVVSPARTALFAGGVAIGTALLMSQIQGNAKNAVCYQGASTTRNTGGATVCQNDTLPNTF